MSDRLCTFQCTVLDRRTKKTIEKTTVALTWMDNQMKIGLLINNTWVIGLAQRELKDMLMIRESISPIKNKRRKECYFWKDKELINRLKAEKCSS